MKRHPERGSHIQNNARITHQRLPQLLHKDTLAHSQPTPLHVPLSMSQIRPKKQKREMRPHRAGVKRCPLFQFPPHSRRNLTSAPHLIMNSFDNPAQVGMSGDFVRFLLHGFAVLLFCLGDYREGMDSIAPRRVEGS